MTTTAVLDVVETDDMLHLTVSRATAFPFIMLLVVGALAGSSVWFSSNTIAFVVLLVLTGGSLFLLYRRLTTITKCL